jgi:hypothetical protein
MNHKMFTNLLSLTPGPRIGVMISGGADSTLLLYLLLNENQLCGKNIKLFCIPSNDNAAVRATIVADSVAKIFKLPTPTIYFIGNPYQHHSTLIWNTWQDIKRRDIVDHLFIGDNQTPKVLTEDSAPIRSRSRDPFIAQPFFDLTKDKLIQKYYELGIEFLLKFTHSCAYDIDPGCGTCWQCKERAWAFQQIRKNDPLLTH